MEQLRVLLVEDDEDDYFFTKDLLAEISGGQFTLDWAASYESGREMILRGEYDVCLLDYRLGANSGMELLREARAHDDLTPIIMLTGQEDREVDLEAMRAGATDYLVKGQLNAAMLERVIRYAVEERRRTQERWQLHAARQAQAEAEAANRAKDDFLALVSHELRSPLSSILGWSRILKQNPADLETATKAIEIIERNAMIQRQLIEDLLDLARVTTGKLHLEVQGLSLRRVINEALDVVRPAAEGKGVEIRTNYDPASDFISGDPNRLQQVIWNLLSNAIKFTPAGGLITIESRRADSFIEICVTDTGEGIHSEVLPFIFDRYRQADTASGSGRAGLGLGLALVRQLVEAHGGVVKATSKGKGKGAVFTVKLPLQSGKVEADDFLKNIRILAVDDEKDSLTLVALTLRQRGAEVMTASSVAEALALLSASKELPDLIVSDIGMPETDGYTFIRQLRQLSPAKGGRIPAIALTAFGFVEDRVRALAAGFQTHIVKPFDPVELSITVASLTNQLKPSQ